ncbi:hypothetical protein [Microscilla marina]|uniref:Uncharacterized protein n=1 Tax=Microscilla marina ATCC 23134 TaxID=313606 RepID=A1ZJA6_MICM2|nr:hypothetical protein [Microscilla marina]EAY29642.1 hypothetical protein M23134_00526 [Microscilla marina ATCC 23134]
MYHHKASNAKIFYDHLGIHISFLGSKLIIAWNEIEFCSITPALEKVNGEWCTYNKKPIAQLQLIELKFVIKNRPSVLNRASFIMKLLLWFGLRLKPLLAADDTPTHHTGVFTLEIHLKKQKNIGNEFISIVENYVKLDILYSL